MVANVSQGATGNNDVGKKQREVVYALRLSANDALTAFAGGGQANGTPLAYALNRFTTVATIADSATLPQGKAGDIVGVKNAAANSMNVFPASGQIINALAADAAFAVAGAKNVLFICYVDGTWDTLLSA